ncbi:MAG: hypothetical protein IT477_10870 [Rhodanobacteraceae bacterium]|nr:hypothetical protein [Rhodanobacteraceae bacterium]
MSYEQRTWWGARYKTKHEFYYKHLRRNPIDCEVPIYRPAEGTCASCGKGYMPGEGHRIEIVRRYPDPYFVPLPGQKCDDCRSATIRRLLATAVEYQPPKSDGASGTFFFFLFIVLACGAVALGLYGR